MTSLTPPDFPIRLFTVECQKASQEFLYEADYPRTSFVYFFRCLEINVYVDQKPYFLTIIWTSDNNLMFALLIDKHGPQLSNNRFYRSVIGADMEPLMDSIMDKITIFRLVDGKFEVMKNIQDLKKQALNAARTMKTVDRDYFKFYEEKDGKPFLVIKDHRYTEKTAFSNGKYTSTFEIFDKKGSKNITSNVLSLEFTDLIREGFDNHIFCLFGKKDKPKNIRFFKTRGVKENDMKYNLFLLHKNNFYTVLEGSLFYRPICIKGEIMLPNIGVISPSLDVSKYEEIEDPRGSNGKYFSEDGKCGVEYHAGAQFGTKCEGMEFLSDLTTHIKNFPRDLKTLTNLLEACVQGSGQDINQVLKVF